jgi:probable F420-dependent oxidoreductase
VAAASGERNQFHSLWVLERILNDRMNVLEPLTTLTYCAAATDRIKLGAGVILTPYRNPIVLAKTIATLDNLSSGRLILGIGQGGSPAESEAAGIDPREKTARFSESLRLMRALWMGERVTFQGRFWRLNDVTMKPPPVQKPIPAWFGALSDSALRRAVRLGDGWLGAGAVGLDEFARASARVDELLRKRTKSEFVKGKRVYIHIDSDERRAEHVLQRWMTSFYGPRAADVTRTCVYGSAARCVDALARYANAGAEVIVLHPVEDFAAQMEIYAKDVLPSF